MGISQSTHPPRMWAIAGATVLLTAAYYGARSVASTVVYDQLGRTEAVKVLSFLPFAMLLMLPVGGLIADKWLGLRRSLIVGAAMVAGGVALCIVRSPPFL